MSRGVPTPTPPPEQPRPEPEPEEAKAATEDEPQAQPQPEEKPRGRRKASGEPPPFKPKVTSLHVNAVRKVRTGDYETIEVMMHLEAVPDPHYSMRQNIATLGGLVLQEAQELAERVAREIEISRG